MKSKNEKFDIDTEFDTLVMYQKYLLEESKKFDRDSYEEYEKCTMSYHQFKELIEKGDSIILQYKK